MPSIPLPIDELLPKLVSELAANGALVLKAEPGAGKTTRVAPAILDAGLANLPSKRPGQIILLQPRRVAARAAAARISEERGTELGNETGYQVRQERRLSKQTRILVCTEGIFLRRLQNDPLLEGVSAVVFDEFHERTLDSDLALALVRQVRREIRDDLKIVVMSATLDTLPISEYLNNCPRIESPGRTFPVEVEYLQFPSSLRLEQLAAETADKVITRTKGHILVFLPGMGEIRQTQKLLEGRYGENTVIMPLYGDMPLSEQQAVLTPTSKQKLILATNVAETSLTIDGVSLVIDSGYAKVNRFDPQLGLNRLELARISKASASQRTGRAGRTASGHCLRLWTEREQQMLSDFEKPEIARVELSECLLQLIAWGETNVQDFPWFEPPPANAVEKALELLERLDALQNGTLTEIGREMAKLPLQPRLARLLLEAQALGETERATICAALLSERDPLRRPDRNWVVQHKSSSDIIDRVHAIEEFEQLGTLNHNGMHLARGTAKQILRTAEQLIKLTSETSISSKISTPSSAKPATADEALMKALLVCYPDRVCKRRELGGRRALMVGGRGVKLSEESAVTDQELFIAIEFIDTGQPESLVKLASGVEKEWLPPSHLTTAIEVEYDLDREKVMAWRRQRFCDLLLSETPTAVPPGTDISSMLADALADKSDLETLVDEQAHSYLARVERLRECAPELNLPDFGPTPWYDLLPEWCAGMNSLAELRSTSLIPAIQARLTHQQIIEIDQEMPEKIAIPSGRKVTVEYKRGQPPVLAARIQELFGLTETPKVGRSRVTVLLHLLAPNYRIQQITPDLTSFWKNTYPDIKKELKGRYPKHHWPEDPTKPLPDRYPNKKS